MRIHLSWLSSLHLTWLVLLQTHLLRQPHLMLCAATDVANARPLYTLHASCPPPPTADCTPDCLAARTCAARATTAPQPARAAHACAASATTAPPPACAAHAVLSLHLSLHH